MRATDSQKVAPRAPFSADAARAAFAEWGANCGPGAVAAIMAMTLDEVRPHFVAAGFDGKRYTNPTMMWSILDSIGRPWRRVAPEWPAHGLARIQWEGPWTAQGVPMRARYRHTHWVGHMRGAHSCGVFDINAMSAGGWISRDDWSGLLVPWLLAEIEPRASGGWHITHAVEVEP